MVIRNIVNCFSWKWGLSESVHSPPKTPKWHSSFHRAKSLRADGVGRSHIAAGSQLCSHPVLLQGGFLLSAACQLRPLSHRLWASDFLVLLPWTLCASCFPCSALSSLIGLLLIFKSQQIVSLSTSRSSRPSSLPWKHLIAATQTPGGPELCLSCLPLCSQKVLDALFCGLTPGG